jgi:hypothetical protein
MTDYREGLGAERRRLEAERASLAERQSRLEARGGEELPEATRAALADLRAKAEAPVETIDDARAAEAAVEARGNRLRDAENLLAQHEAAKVRNRGVRARARLGAALGAAAAAFHCREATVCITEGRCTLRNGACVAAFEQDCRRSEACVRAGACSPAPGGTCAALVHSDCELSSACREQGFCSAEDGRCKEGEGACI